MIDALATHLRALAERPKLRTDLRVPFADGVYRFALPPREAAELERVCGYSLPDGTHQPLGLGALFSRMAKGRAFVPDGTPDWSNVAISEVLAAEFVERDCHETIRLALIGGGEGEVNGRAVTVKPADAKRLLDLYVVDRPLQDAWTLAFAILGARIYGRAADPETGL
ncbi:MAG: hypothetical protein A4S16_03455 [Proteobacteria bacterium SG_bin6]|nr:MAG: hypothetical protein A4S16_03455 [Proteobacteria bacterium SG_bin6]